MLEDMKDIWHSIHAAKALYGLEASVSVRQQPTGHAHQREAEGREEASS